MPHLIDIKDDTNSIPIPYFQARIMLPILHNYLDVGSEGLLPGGFSMVEEKFEAGKPGKPQPKKPKVKKKKRKKRGLFPGEAVPARRDVPPKG